MARKGSTQAFRRSRIVPEGQLQSFFFLLNCFKTHKQLLLNTYNFKATFQGQICVHSELFTKLFSLNLDDHSSKKLKNLSLSQNMRVLWRSPISCQLFLLTLVQAHTTTIMAKTADSTLLQETITDTIHMQGKPQKVTADGPGCSQRLCQECSWKVNQKGKAS